MHLHLDLFSALNQRPIFGKSHCLGPRVMRRLYTINFCQMIGNVRLFDRFEGFDIHTHINFNQIMVPTGGCIIFDRYWAAKKYYELCIFFENNNFTNFIIVWFGLINSISHYYPLENLVFPIIITSTSIFFQNGNLHAPIRIYTKIISNKIN